jgi:ferredoxin
MDRSKKRILIITFSPGGGCADLADAATILYRRAGYMAEVVDITDPESRELATTLELHADLLLAILPVYALHLPRPVIEFFTSAQLFAPRSALILGYGSCGVGAAPSEAAELFDVCETPLFRIMKCPLEHSLAKYSNVKQELPDSLDAIGDFLLSAADDPIGEVPPAPIMAGLSKLIPSKLIMNPAISIPQTDASKCAYCDICYRACPTAAISQGSPAINKSRCIRCGACVKYCPEGAKDMKVSPWLVKFFDKKFADPKVPQEIKRKIR